MDFSHYSGFILFMFIFTAGFWLLIFALTVIVPYWLFGAWIDMYKEYKENKSNKIKEEDLSEEAIL
jgi:predicted membrane protein